MHPLISAAGLASVLASIPLYLASPRESMAALVLGLVLSLLITGE